MIPIYYIYYIIVEHGIYIILYPEISNPATTRHAHTSWRLLKKMKALAIGIIFLQKLSLSDKGFKRYELNHGIAVYPFSSIFQIWRGAKCEYL